MRISKLMKIVLTGLLVSSLAAISWAQSPKLKMTTDIPASITTPDKVSTSIGTLEFFDGVPTDETVKTVYDNLDRMRGLDVFLNCLPGASMFAIRKGLRSIGQRKSHQITIFDKLMSSESLYLTANTSTLYAFPFLDLKNDGPTVAEIPPGMLGAFNDMWFRYAGDVGPAGPDKGKGGKYLVLPPGYKGDVPDGYFVVRPKTYGVWIFLRGSIAKGLDAAVKNFEDKLKVYPLARKDDPPKMEFVSASAKSFNTISPNDYGVYEDLNQLVQEEPLEALDAERRWQLERY